MANWRQLAMSALLADGAIDEREVEILRKEFFADRRIDREHDRKNAGSGPAAPAEGIEQSNVEHPKRRMHSARNSQHHKCNRGNQPRRVRQAHEDELRFD